MAPPVQACEIDSVNVQAFLKLLRWLENYPRDDSGVYFQMFGGSTFSKTGTHPNIVNSKWGKSSTAAGAYMFVYGTWKEAFEKGIVPDFSPASQDILAWWKIGQRKAQIAVCGGRNNLDDAFKLLRPEWASLPGATQNQVSAQDAKNKYETYLVELSNPAPAAASGGKQK